MLDSIDKYSKSIPFDFKQRTEQYFVSVKKKLKQTIWRIKLVGFIDAVLILSLIAVQFFLIIISIKFLTTHKEVFSINSDLLLIPALFVCATPLILFNRDFFSSRLSEILLKDYLSNESIRFCYLQIVVDNLIDYKRNGISEHLIIARKNLENYLDYENVYVSFDEGLQPLEYNVDGVIQDLIEQFPWFKVREDSLLISKAFDKIETTLLHKIANGDSIDTVIPLLEILKGYSYCNIEKISNEIVVIDESDISIQEYSNFLLWVFAEQMNLIPEYKNEKKPTYIVKWWRKYLNTKISYLYENYLSLLLSLVFWLVLLNLFLIILPVFFLQKNGVVVSSEIIAAGYFATLGVAVTILKTKSKKK